ncbi:putative Lysosomal acid lipase/cholesteryl ester hydrolase [Paratrimastix pyriformis]|uniref:Lysosomal acid lipase/cholesteryl ester hydrolase n=1 Tax=Paratrimastix pyriformis TaxID=342808 RepID=A0ABQ8URB1_9EUKA|nr:putative Lysosomal acid lipase/cholesteryl ester hydrolase [Paratrimastix pyriformis]
MALLAFPTLFTVLVFFSMMGMYVKAQDADCKRNITQMIEARGFRTEIHQVLTDDGFILTMFRIPPRSPGAPVAFLQHGVMDCAVTWIMQGGVDESLAYILASEGYDVWMGNNRGNIYSMSHTTLDPAHEPFWRWSVDEMAQYDLPAMFTHVMRTTGASRIRYVGHSQGCEQMFMRLAMELAGQWPAVVSEHLAAFVGLGPVMTVSYLSNPAVTILIDAHAFEGLRDVHYWDFLPTTELLGKLFPYLCGPHPSLCESVVGLIAGWDKSRFNDSRMEVVSAHEPGGVSTFDMIHWSQMFRAKSWRRADYGAAENMRRYGQTSPPAYPMEALKKIDMTRTTVGLFSGTKDVLADEADVDILINLLWTAKSTAIIPSTPILPDASSLDTSTTALSFLSEAALANNSVRLFYLDLYFRFVNPYFFLLFRPLRDFEEQNLVVLQRQNSCLADAMRIQLYSAAALAASAYGNTPLADLCRHEALGIAGCLYDRIGGAPTDQLMMSDRHDVVDDDSSSTDEGDGVLVCPRVRPRPPSPTAVEIARAFALLSSCFRYSPPRSTHYLNIAWRILEPSNAVPLGAFINHVARLHVRPFLTHSEGDIVPDSATIPILDPPTPRRPLSPPVPHPPSAPAAADDPASSPPRPHVGSPPGKYFPPSTVIISRTPISVFLHRSTFVPSDTMTPLQGLVEFFVVNYVRTLFFRDLCEELKARGWPTSDLGLVVFPRPPGDPPPIESAGPLSVRMGTMVMVWNLLIHTFYVRVSPEGTADGRPPMTFLPFKRTAASSGADHERTVSRPPPLPAVTAQAIWGELMLMRDMIHSESCGLDLALDDPPSPSPPTPTVPTPTSPPPPHSRPHAAPAPAPSDAGLLSDSLARWMAPFIYSVMCALFEAWVGNHLESLAFANRAMAVHQAQELKHGRASYIYVDSTIFPLVALGECYHYLLLHGRLAETTGSAPSPSPYDGVLLTMSPPYPPPPPRDYLTPPPSPVPDTTTNGSQAPPPPPAPRYALSPALADRSYRNFGRVVETLQLFAERGPGPACYSHRTVSRLYREVGLALGKVQPPSIVVIAGPDADDTEVGRTDERAHPHKAPLGARAGVEETEETKVSVRFQVASVPPPPTTSPNPPSSPVPQLVTRPAQEQKPIVPVPQPSQPQHPPSQQPAQPLPLRQTELLPTAPPASQPHPSLRFSRPLPLSVTPLLPPPRLHPPLPVPPQLGAHTMAHIPTAAPELRLMSLVSLPILSDQPSTCIHQPGTRSRHCATPAAPPRTLLPSRTRHGPSSKVLHPGTTTPSLTHHPSPAPFLPPPTAPLPLALLQQPTSETPLFSSLSPPAPDDAALLSADHFGGSPMSPLLTSEIFPPAPFDPFLDAGLFDPAQIPPWGDTDLAGGLGLDAAPYWI